uniref:CBS domain-containing protein n=1 Tax=uncultured Oxalicibacterium sp. TaxID=1168540 RepID=UPI0034569F97
MIIERNITKYVIFSEDTLQNALRRISENKSGVVFAISDAGVLEGVLTDGDLRRWLVSQDNVDLEQRVSVALNREFVSFSDQTDPE